MVLHSASPQGQVSMVDSGPFIAWWSQGGRVSRTSFLEAGFKRESRTAGRLKDGSRIRTASLLPHFVGRSK